MELAREAQPAQRVPTSKVREHIGSELPLDARAEPLSARIWSPSRVLIQ
jgi:hypothetical protein